jgi:hypothetical protein
MRVEREGLVATVFVGIAALALHACAGDRLELPVFDDSGIRVTPVTPDGSCTQCSGECVDTKTDPRHCGTCTTTCTGGSACVAGQCSLACPTGLVNCAGMCVDPTTSAEHCGATGACDGANAGTKCASGLTCNNGVCGSGCPASSPNACGTGATALCTSFKIDPAHCGNCTTACGTGQVCTNSACACPAARPDVCGTGAAATCTDFKTDPTRCGNCNTSCGVGKVCNNGACGIACSALQTTCGTGATATCHTPTAPNDCCGTLCGRDKDCSAAGCVACTPTTFTIATNPTPTDANLKVTCINAAFQPVACPVVRCGGVTFFAYSYLDNRTSLGIVGYDVNGAIVKGLVEKPGARYVETASVAGGNVTWTGQGAQTVIMPFSDFRVP